MPSKKFLLNSNIKYKLEILPGYEMVRFPKILPLNGGFRNPLMEFVANIKTTTTSRNTATVLLKFMLGLSGVFTDQRQGLTENMHQKCIFMNMIFFRQTKLENTH